jgi:sporulation protein YabP
MGVASSGAARARHSVQMDNRAHLQITGVERVEAFDHEQVVLVTSLGVLRIVGHDLHIQGLDLEAGSCGVDGSVESLSYREGRGGERRASLIARLVR